MSILLLVVLGGLMDAARSFAPNSIAGSGAAGTSLACGYLLLSAFFVGGLFKRAGLPQLTGYLVTGIVVGPKVLNLVSQPMVANLSIFNGVAIALIALTAGVELDLRSMKPLLRSIAWLIGVAIIGTSCLLTAAVFLARSLLPFLRDLTTGQAAAVALVLGVTMAAQSPAVVVALHAEMKAQGPLSQTVLGVVVMSDLVVILLFAVVSSLAKVSLGAKADALATAALLAWEILGSLGAGVLLGILLAAYLRLVKGGGLFVVTAAFVVAEVGQRVDLDPLLVALAAGMLARNVTKMGDRLQEEIEAASLPVYVAFFAVTGATIHLEELLVVGIPAVIFVLVRAAGFLSGARLATRFAAAPNVVRKYAGLGLLPQAGLALALAILFVKTFPSFGSAAAALVFGAVAINEMVAPVLYRVAVVRSGEAGRKVTTARSRSASDPLRPASPVAANGL
jgi:Kef-type K+ transport system membrane component KefB